MSFKNQVVLITGASNGIGRRLAIDLAKKGAIVIGCGRAQGRLQETLAEMRRASPSSTVVPCDVGDREQVRAMVRNVLAEFGKIDILINNAGIGMRKPFVETSLDTIEEIMRVNYLGTVYCTHEVLPSMIAKRSGHIVNISSVAGKIGALNMAPLLCVEVRPPGTDGKPLPRTEAAGDRYLRHLPGSRANEFQPPFRRLPTQSTGGD